LNNINLGTLIPLVFSILAGGAGCALIVMALHRKRTEITTNSWLPAAGVILSSEVKEHQSIKPGNQDRTVFSPLVHYQYTCTGRTFAGLRVTFNQLEYTESKAREIADRYVAGAPVTVYYDPLHPEEAVIERNTTRYQSILTTGLVLFALGAGSFCMTFVIYWAEKAFH